MTEEKDRRARGEIHREYYDDEINLFDYILVLWRWKWLVVLGTLVSVIVAIVITLQMPESYRVSMDIEPNVTGLDDKGNKLYMDSKEIVDKINNGRYNGDIEKSMGKTSPSVSLSFKAGAVKYTNLITVESTWGKNDLDAGLEASKILGSLLIEDYKANLEKHREDTDALIKIELEKIEKAEKAKEDTVKSYMREYLKQIDTAQENITLQKQILKETRDRLSELSFELKKFKGSLAEMIVRRDSLLKIGGKVEDVYIPYYEAAIRNWQLRTDQIGEMIFSARIKEQQILYEIRRQYLEIKYNNELIEDIQSTQADQLQERIKTFKEGMEKLSVMRAAISNIKVVRQPEASSTPVKSSKGKKIILLSGMAALFMFIFLAFFIEYIRNARREYLSGQEKG